MNVDKKSKSVVRTVIETENFVSLELTETEAAILCAVASRIQGWNTTHPNPRKELTDELYRLLNGQGYGEGNETYHTYRKALGSGEYKFSTI